MIMAACPWVFNIFFYHLESYKISFTMLFALIEDVNPLISHEHLKQGNS